MVVSSNSPAVATLRFDDMLFNAVVFNWNELMPEAAAGQMQIEYHVGPAGSVEFVKVWGAIIRGHWDLICEYWMGMDTPRQSGLRFANGHTSEILPGMLGSIMQHQELFHTETAPNTNCMIQVSPPTETERASALKTMDVLRARLAN